VECACEFSDKAHESTLQARLGEETLQSARNRLVVVVAAVATALAFELTPVSASDSSSAPTSLSWLRPAPAPAGWKSVALPSHVGELWYPPTMRPTAGDATSVSVALEDAQGTFLEYLNAGPPSGGERIGSWTTFRLAHLRAEGDTSVSRDAQSFRLALRGGTGSCVIDDYVTHVKSNHYREIACFGQGRTSASVVVAAALASDWTRFGPQLERAVAAWQLR
jgi:hypothetical protein